MGCRRCPIEAILSIPSEELRYYRGGEMAMIFQEPMSSLNPVYNIEFQLTEAILLHQKVTPEQAKNQAIYPVLEELVIDVDGGAATRSNRTQFIKRMVEFAQKTQWQIRLIY